MNEEFGSYLEEIAEKHLPVSFLDYEMLLAVKEILIRRTFVGRKEMLTLAYIIGADSEEGDELLRLSGHPALYVKSREDAIWKFALDHQMDGRTVMDEIFRQNMGEAPGETAAKD